MCSDGQSIAGCESEVVGSSSSIIKQAKSDIQLKTKNDALHTLTSNRTHRIYVDDTLVDKLTDARRYQRACNEAGKGQPSHYRDHSTVTEIISFTPS